MRLVRVSFPKAKSIWFGLNCDKSLTSSAGKDTFLGFIFLSENPDVTGQNPRLTMDKAGPPRVFGADRLDDAMSSGNSPGTVFVLNPPLFNLVSSLRSSK
jgi:hypothetical protein